MSVVEHDVVIVGGGHNGLACAAYLANAGLDVAVLERRGVLGGAAITEEPWPGYQVSPVEARRARRSRSTAPRPA